MNIGEKFDKQSWSKSLARRRENFRFMCEHVAKWRESGKLTSVVETGTAWDKGNFDGQGQSTIIWDWLSSELNFEVISIDIRPEASEVARKQTSRVYYVTSDSVSHLSKLKNIDSIALLYLDSFDWSPELNIESSFHHMMELATVYSKLPSGCLIVVDDRHGDMKGKHWMVEFFMKKLDAKIAFKNHQMGWFKP